MANECLWSGKCGGACPKGCEYFTPMGDEADMAYYACVLVEDREVYTEQIKEFEGDQMV